MWRLGVLMVVAALIEFSLADVQPTNDELIQRLKRSPNYCDSYPSYPHRPRHWPHPPPPYWPPPPPPGPPPPPYWPPPPPGPPPPSYWSSSSASSQSAQQQPPSQPQPTQPEPQNVSSPCSTCGDNPSANTSAISNAQSGSGEAIAIAVSRGK